MANHLGIAKMDSPIGPLLLASTQKGLCFIEFGTGEEAMAALRKWCQKYHPEVTPEHDEELNEPAKKQLQEYFAGERKSFDIPLDLYGTDFQKAVWNALRAIPYGETRSYKEIAAAAGNAKAVRAVGGANNRNPIPVIVPCHRVIGTNGSMVGYAGGLSIKEYLLNLENPLRKDAVVPAYK